MPEYAPPVLYEDNHLLVVDKPAGMLTQSDISGDDNLLDVCREYIRVKYQKKGNVFLGMVHRLDRPVTGVIVFARTSKAASRLSEQFREGSVEKRYLAVVEGILSDSRTLVHHLVRTGSVTRASVEPMPGSQQAELSYSSLSSSGCASLVDITLVTGRKHQIRAQFTSIGHPIFGDRSYGAIHIIPGGRIALMCRKIAFLHPTRDEIMTFSVAPPEWWPWDCVQQEPLS